MLNRCPAARVVQALTFLSPLSVGKQGLLGGGAGKRKVKGGCMKKGEQKGKSGKQMEQEG